MIMKIVEALLISTLVLATGTLLLRLPTSAQSTAFAQGDDGQPCHLLTSSSPIPPNWGAPFNTLSSSRELILSASSSSGGATISADTGAPTQYIYENAYEYRDGAWHAFTYTGSQKTGPSLVGQGSATLSRTQAQLSQNRWSVENWLEQ